MKEILLKMKKYTRLSFKLAVMLIIGFSILLTSCSKEEKEPAVIITELSQEIKDLVYFKGNEKASVVVINAQSGPDITLSTSEVDFIFESVDTADLLVVNVHQSQSLDPSIVTVNDLTLEQAIDFNAESIETLYKVIKFFKDQGRTVHVFGASFGAFVVQELIATKGIDVADAYLIMIGRLDMNDVMWQGLVDGKFGYFMDGVAPVLDPEPALGVVDRNIGKISAALGMKRYTELLADEESLSNVTYIYGAIDQIVGRLTDEEVQFLVSKNATVIEGSGGHDDTFLDFIEQGLELAFNLK